MQRGPTARTGGELFITTGLMASSSSGTPTRARSLIVARPLAVFNVSEWSDS